MFKSQPAKNSIHISYGRSWTLTIPWKNQQLLKSTKCICFVMSTLSDVTVIIKRLRLCSLIVNMMTLLTPSIRMHIFSQKVLCCLPPWNWMKTHLWQTTVDISFEGWDTKEEANLSSSLFPRIAIVLVVCLLNFVIKNSSTTPTYSTNQSITFCLSQQNSGTSIHTTTFILSTCIATSIRKILLKRGKKRFPVFRGKRNNSAILVYSSIFWILLSKKPCILQRWDMEEIISAFRFSGWTSWQRTSVESRNSKHTNQQKTFTPSLTFNLDPPTEGGLNETRYANLHRHLQEQNSYCCPPDY